MKLIDWFPQGLSINFYSNEFLQQSLKQNIRMSQQPKFPMPPIPYRFPFPYPPMNIDKLKLPQTNLPPTANPNGPTLPNNMPPGAFMPPRMFNPYFGGYGMFSAPPGPPYHPYFPMMAPPQISSMTAQNSKNANNANQQQKRPMNLPPYINRMQPPFMNPAMCYPFGAPQYRPQQPKKKITKNISPEQKTTQKPINKEIKSFHSSQSQMPIIKDESKVLKAKQVKHSEGTHYEPIQPKKKMKKQQSNVLDRPQRETRQKKQSIQKLMAHVMKEKPLRDRVIKIGKQYQAVIPESFVNQYEYNLKIKLQKKQNLMSRLISSPA